MTKLTYHDFKVIGHAEENLRFHPLSEIGDSVIFEHGEVEGEWILAYADLLKMVQLAKEARGAAKPEGWELDLLNKIAEKKGLPAGADLEGILDLL